MLYTVWVLCIALVLYPLTNFLYTDRHSVHTLQYLHSPFSKCSNLDGPCFDWNSPCQHSTAIYIYPPDEGSWFERSYFKSMVAKTTELQKFQRRIEFALRTDPSLTVVDDPNQACLFIPHISCLSVNSCALPRIFAKARLTRLPSWNNGRNHIVLDHGDDPFAYVASGDGAEIRMRSASSTQFHRKGFDIGLSLRPKVSTYGDVVKGGAAFAASQRPILVGFLGAPTTTATTTSTSTSTSTSSPPLDLRRSLMTLHDVQRNIHIIVRPPTCAVPCPQHQPEYYTEYKSMLFQSQFQLVPRGQGLHSHRLLESIASGSVPIVLADHIVLPFADIIPWEKAILVVKEQDWSSVPTIARTHLKHVQEMQCAGLAIYRHFFLRPHGTINIGMRLLQQRVRRHPNFRGNATRGTPELLPSWPHDRIPKVPSFCRSSVRG